MRRPAGRPGGAGRGPAGPLLPPPYVGGRGWLGVRLDGDEVDWDEIAEIVTDAYREIAPKKLVALLDRPRTS